MLINVNAKPLTQKQLEVRQQRLRGEFIWAILTTSMVLWLAITEQGLIQMMFMGAAAILLWQVATIHIESTSAYTLVDEVSLIKVIVMSEKCEKVEKYWKAVCAEGRPLVASELTALTQAYQNREMTHTVTVQLESCFVHFPEPQRQSV